MGTKNDIVWFQKILQRHPKIEVLEISELYSNKGTNKYYRAYAEVQKTTALSNPIITYSHPIRQQATGDYAPTHIRLLSMQPMER